VRKSGVCVCECECARCEVCGERMNGWGKGGGGSEGVTEQRTERRAQYNT
jgi:hypothetical protein